MSKVAQKFEKLVKADGAFNFRNQNKIGITTVPISAPKHARDIAAAQPWTGTESTHDLTLRMLNDSHKPLKEKDRGKRINRARNGALDYRMNESEGPTFRERIKDPRKMSSGISTGGTIDSIANSSIEDAIARGQFDDLPRGKRIDPKEYRLLNPYIDTTELILNRMIKKQGAAPPWILKQREMHNQVEVFKEATIKKMLDRLVHFVVENRTNDPHTLRAGIREWLESQRTYFDLAIDSLNRSIRSYNLQAPQSARKGYLDARLVDDCFNCSLTRLDKAVDIFNGKRKIQAAENLHRSEKRLENPNKQYGLKDMVREWLTRG